MDWFCPNLSEPFSPFSTLLGLLTNKSIDTDNKKDTEKLSLKYIFLPCTH